MKKTIKEFIEIFGFAASLTYIIAFLWILLPGYLRGREVIQVHINTLNERGLETAILIASIPCIIYFWYKMLWKKNKTL